MTLAWHVTNWRGTATDVTGTRERETGGIYHESTETPFARKSAFASSICCPEGKGRARSTIIRSATLGLWKEA